MQAGGQRQGLSGRLLPAKAGSAKNDHTAARGFYPATRDSAVGALSLRGFTLASQKSA